MALPFSSIPFQITLITILTLVSTLSSSPTPPNYLTRPFKKIYAFGDSYTDTGNTRSTTGPSGFNYVSNLPYGCTFFHRPTNRYSDGRLIIDFVAQALSLPFLPPYLDKNADKSTGVNFAVAGSTAIPHSFFVKNNMTLNITPQSIESELYWFEKAMEEKGCGESNKTTEKCREEFSDALFWVGEIGVNDYAYTLGSSVSTDTVRPLAIKSHAGFLQALLRKGAKYIVVQGLPPTGCLPLALTLEPENDRDSLGCVASANKLTFDHNTLLKSKLHDLRTQFPHSTIVYADYWNAYETIIKNRAKYNIKEPFQACCGAGGGPLNYDIFNACGAPSATVCKEISTYVNWDGVHLTEAMYKAVSDLLLNGNFSHPSFQFLLSKKNRATEN